MNADVAGDAILKLRLLDAMERSDGRLEAKTRFAEPENTGVALQAKSEYRRAFEEPGIGGAVGRMAAFAALNTHRGMLVYKRPADIYMALHAGFVVAEGLRYHARPDPGAPSRVERPVRVVAIGAVDCAFVHPVVEGHIKLRLGFEVAGITEIPLLFREQEFRRLRAMNGMAIGTYHIVRGVDGSPDIGLAKILRVASQTSIENHFRGASFNPVDQAMIGWLLGMLAPGTVTALAAEGLPGGRSRNNDLVVRVAGKISPDCGMAELARVVPKIAGTAQLLRPQRR